MKKLFFSLFTLLFLLSACNLPVGQSTPAEDVIATRVAGTLAASTLTENQSLPTLDISTTEAPSTPSATPTETVTPTATTSPDDPRLTLGNPVFWFNSASSGDPFGVISDPFNDDAVAITNEVDGVKFASNAINLGKRWRMTSKKATNLYLEGTFHIISCSGKDNYGLAFRKPTYGSDTGYYVGLSCDGNYIVDRGDDGGNGENLISWTPDTNIKTGANQVNRIGVMLVNDSFKIYINGVLVKEFSNSTITAEGYVGVYASARGDPNFTVILQELMEWDQ